MKVTNKMQQKSVKLVLRFKILVGTVSAAFIIYLGSSFSFSKANQAIPLNSTTINSMSEAGKVFSLKSKATKFLVLKENEFKKCRSSQKQSHGIEKALHSKALKRNKSNLSGADPVVKLHQE